VRPVKDPAPSKWRYRLQRLWLTPSFRWAVRWGLPGLAVAAGIGAYLGDEARLTAIRDRWDETVRAIQDRPEFMVSMLRIEGASEQLQEDIQEALPVDLPLSQFVLDLDGLRVALEQLDPVAHAEVRIRPGGVLLLRVTERRPAIAWQHEGRLLALDAEGHHVAQLPDVSAAGALPLMAGAGADRAAGEALALIDAAAPVADRLVGLARIGGRRWDVVLTGGQRILLPEDAPAAALDRVLAMHAAHDVLNRDVRAVDLRLRDRPTLRLTASARDTLRAMQDEARLNYEREDE
jgi:cell division protein FtsQ